MQSSAPFNCFFFEFEKKIESIFEEKKIASFNVGRTIDNLLCSLKKLV
jgi:hypothetical protein